MTYLLLVNGLPGTGKTTLANKLKKDLALPCLYKDHLKEFFFDELGVDGREESRMLGRATSDSLYIVAREYLAANKSLMIENAFFVEFAKPAFSEILQKYPAKVIEIFCATEKEVRRKRFAERHLSGKRHQGHQDGTDLALLSDDDPDPVETYAPLELGTVIKVDTTVFGDREYSILLDKIREEYYD